MPEPTPVKIVGEPVKVEDVGGETKAEAPKPAAVESVKTTTETVKTTGDPSTVTPPLPAVVADDNARKWLAVAVIVQFLVLVGIMVYSGKRIDDTQMILGAEITFVTSVLNFYFGSSSGSIAKDARNTHPKDN